MSSSSADDVLIEAILRDFSRQLQSALPLRHFGECYDEEQLKEKILQLKENVSKTLFSKVWNRDREQVIFLLKKLRERMNKEVIADWKTKNERHKIESVSYLQKRAEMLCEDFNMALEDQLLLNADMEIDSLKNFVERQKVFAINYFDGLWEPNNSQMKQERKTKMVKSLAAIGEEVIEKQQLVLESNSVDKGKKLVDEAKKIIMEKWRQLKSYVESQPGRVSKPYLMAEVVDIKEYLLNGKGSALRENANDVYSMVVETLEDGIKYLSADAERQVKSPQDYIRWAEGLGLKLKFYCGIDEARRNGAEQDIQKERNAPGCSERRDCAAIQQLLLEDPFGFSEPQETEDENRTSDDASNYEMAEHICGGEGKEIRIVEKTDSKADDRHEPARPTKRARLSRLFPLNSPLTVTDKDQDQALINDHSHAVAHDGPVPKKLRPGGNISSIAGTKTENMVHRQTVVKSGVNDEAGNFNAAQATSTRRSSRLKKKIDGPIRTKGTTGTRENVPKQSSSSLGGKISRSSPDDSPGRRPKSNLGKAGRNTRSASATGESSELSHHSPSISLDRITSLGGNPPTFRCDACKKEIKKKAYLKYHGKFCWVIHRPFKCDHCGMEFYKKSFLVNHIRTHTGEKPYKCPTCDKRFAKNCNLLDHIRACHTGDARFTCGKCQRRFIHRLAFTRHLLHHEGKLPLVCSYCEHRCASMTNLMAHVLTHSDERPFKCATCDRQFRLKYRLIRHIERVHRQQREDADKQANDASAEYLRKVTNNPNYNGEISSLAVLSHAVKKANLRIPDETDTTVSVQVKASGEMGCPKPFTCEKCNRSYYRRSHLKRHNLIKHAEKLPFDCRYCDQRFATITHLREHVIIHCDERPFKCPTCERPFSWKTKLVRHIQRTHHQPREDAIKLANEAGTDYLRKVTNNPNYDGDISPATVLSHAIKKAKLQIPDQAVKKCF